MDCWEYNFRIHRQSENGKQNCKVMCDWLRLANKMVWALKLSYCSLQCHPENKRGLW